MLRKTRIILAAIFFVAVTVLFLDPSGTLYRWLGWSAKAQFLPALLSLNLVVILQCVIVHFCKSVFGQIFHCPSNAIKSIKKCASQFAHVILRHKVKDRFGIVFVLRDACISAIM